MECTAKDFGTGFVGQSAAATRKIFERGLGKVLFVDEAYRLNPRWSQGTPVLFILFLFSSPPVDFDRPTQT